MNRRLAQVVLDVLSFSRQADYAAGSLERLNSRDWDAGFSWLDRSGLSLYFWHKVLGEGLQGALPLAVSTRFEERYAQNSIRTLAMLEEWRKLQHLFSSAGVPCAVLKGLAKVPEYCPDPALRVQFDHDWLIDRNSMDRVDDLLDFAGYQRKTMREIDRSVYLQNAPSPNDSWNPADSYTARILRPVELHWDLWDSENEKIFFDLPKDLMDRREIRRRGSDVYFSLSDEDALLFEALHAFRHIIHHWCRLSTLFEIAHFLDHRSSDRSLWLKFCARIESNLLLRRAAGVVFTLAERLFGVSNAFREVPAGFFAQTPELKIWVEGYGMNSALDNFSRDKFSLFLLRGFVERKNDWRDVSRRRLFPMRHPHQFRATGRNKAREGLSARYWFYFIRRLGLHMRGTLLYALEFPRWRFMVRRRKKRFPSAVSKAFEADAGRTKLSAARLGL